MAKAGQLHRLSCLKFNAVSLASSGGVVQSFHRLKSDALSAYRGEASFFKGLGVGSPWLFFTPEGGIDEWKINEQAESSVDQSCKSGCSP